MTNVTSKPVPDGYTVEWDNTIWNVGHIFRWSDLYEGWLNYEHRVTVKPGQGLGEVFEGATGEPMWLHYRIFFVNEE